MLSALAGKRILFIGPKTFGYETAIQAALRRAGADVVFVSEWPTTSRIAKGIGRLMPNVLWPYSDCVFRRWLDHAAPADVDIVFVIKGEGISPAFLRRLRDRYARAFFVLYLWDSMENVRGTERKLFAFDRRLSFDPADCSMDSELVYRPLFFLDAYRRGESEGGEGVFFVGTLNGDRPAVLARLLRRSSPGFALDYWLFVRSDLELTLRRMSDRALRQLDPRRLLRTPMSAERTARHLSLSAAALDIEHPRQRGLTMRTFEVLASGKKLITTNRGIASHSFYDPARICVVDRLDPRVPDGFLEGKPKPLPSGFFEDYSIDGWLRDVLVTR